MTNIKRISLSIIFGIYILILLTMVVKGDKGNPIYYQNELDTKVGGVYESSNGNSRFALTRAIVEDRTVFFNTELARFSAPDLVYYNGKFFSIFLPGVSLLSAPFYFIGKLFGMPQLFTYLFTTLLALFNVFLVSAIAKKIGATRFSSFFSGLAFLFATNALAYSQTMTQHHLSTSIILLALLNSTYERSFFKNLWLGVVVGIGILVDIPNIIMLTPIMITILWKHFSVLRSNLKFTVSVKPILLGIIIGIIPLLTVFSWYNFQTTGSYHKIGQFIGRSNFPPPLNPPKKKDNQETKLSKYESSLALNTRNLLQGLYILILSNERGIFYYSPVVILGLLGLILKYQQSRNKEFIITSIGIISMAILTYSMFDDPWGGWSFGPRYLIPAISILCVFISTSVDRFYRNFVFTIFVFLLLGYSIFVNSLGVLTTTAVPPKQEAENLVTPIPYTYEYNKKIITSNRNSSLLYNLFLREKISSANYLIIFIGAVGGLFSLLYMLSILKIADNK